MNSMTTWSDMKRIRSLGIGRTDDGKFLPVSFTYGGKKYQGLPGGVFSSRLIDANMEENFIDLRVDDCMTVHAEAVVYRDFPVVEWTVYFKNDSDKDSAILKDVSGADMHITGPAPRLITNNGDTGRLDGYTDTVTPLPCGETYAQKSEGGRPCQDAFPYQRILFDSYGYQVAIGWPGQWSSTWIGTEDGVHFTAGQETVHTILHPGECLRTPRMCIMAFDGMLERGINLWRRWYFAHVMPRSKGKIFPYMVLENDNGGGIEFTESTEHQQIMAIERMKKAGINPDLWWIDAGWYPCQLDGKPVWQVTGTWKPDPARFPRGFGPVGDAVHDADMEFLVWFEPERVFPGTYLAENHPEWLLHRADPASAYKDRPENMLLNLGNPDCVRWLGDYISRLISESGITIYRQDFNIRPLPFWRENEEKDRQGMLENLYVQGYLAYWDKLKLDHPDLMIDSCASGGRRNDLESMRRSVPFHQTDFGYGHHPTKQKYSQHFYTWIPYFRGYANSWDKDDGEYSWPDFYEPEPQLPLREFDMMNAIAPMMTVLAYRHVEDKPDVVTLQKDIIALYKRIRELLRGDFYSLGEKHCDADKWSVWQFYTPEKQEGVLQFFRNTQAPAITYTGHLHGLEADAVYRFENARTGETRDMTGDQAMTNGFVEKLDKRQASLWIYHTAK